MILVPRLKTSLATLLIGLVLAATGTATVKAFTDAAPARSREAAGALERHARYLASEALMGRGVDTAGIKLARDYIAAEFANYGLRPGGDAGSFLQAFEVAVGVRVEEPSRFRLGDGSPLALNRDWTPLGLSLSGKAAGEIVFAGYGISAKEHGYDDYAGLDVRGKIVLVLRYEPPPQSATSPFKQYPEYSIHSALRTKAAHARENGAAGMILVDLNRSADAQELISTRASLWRGSKSLIAAQVGRGAIEKSLARRGIFLAELKSKIDRSGSPASIPLGVAGEIEVTLREARERAENVVGILPAAEGGSGGENIVIGAHYDHLGRGHFGAFDGRNAGSLHPGADDNASGAAVLLDVARRFAQSPSRPARALVFVAFSAEELGLHGSRHFVRQFSAIAATTAMINLDMVGRLRNDRITVFGSRSAAGLSPVVSAAAAKAGLELNESDDVGRSDHLSFYNRRIPVLHFFTGIHPEYHRPTDTADKLNYSGMAKVSDMVSTTAHTLAQRKDDLQFVSLPSRPPGERQESVSFTAYLGSIPEYATEAPGVQLAGVVAGSPAALAGLQPGDVIVRFAEAEVRTLEDLTAALSGKKPGDRVEIVVVRHGSELRLHATLQARGANPGRG